MIQLPPLKIVISGPVSAGKTTFISTLSETPVLSTDEISSEGLGKVKTTVALDFGSVLFDQQPVHLFGTPGQERFNFMWDVLCQGSTGLIVLVAGNRPKDFPRARHILDFIASRVPIPFILGVTFQDAPRAWGPEEVAEFFQVDLQQTLGLDARRKTDCQKALFHLFQCLQQKSKKGETR